MDKLLIYAIFMCTENSLPLCILIQICSWVNWIISVDMSHFNQIWNIFLCRDSVKNGMTSQGYPIHYVILVKHKLLKLGKPLLHVPILMTFHSPSLKKGRMKVELLKRNGTHTLHQWQYWYLSMGSLQAHFYKCACSDPSDKYQNSHLKFILTYIHVSYSRLRPHITAGAHHCGASKEIHTGSPRLDRRN